jgi:hypothetical protein
VTQLSFVIELTNGSKIKTMGDVEAYFRILNDERHAASHWALAVRMFANAMSEPAYLKAAPLTPDGVCDRRGAHPDEFVTLRGAALAAGSRSGRPPYRCTVMVGTNLFRGGDGCNGRRDNKG